MSPFGTAFRAGYPTTGVTTTTIDSFEDGDISEYSGNTGGFSVVDDSTLSWSAPDGSKVLKRAADGSFAEINSTSGLPNYFPKGNVARCYVRTSGTEGNQDVYFGLQDEPNNYIVNINYDVSVLKLIERSGGSNTELASTSVSPSADSTNYIEITRDDGTLGGADNDITISFVEGGSELASISANNSTHASNDGVGVRVSNNNTADIFWDWYHLR